MLRTLTHALGVLVLAGAILTGLGAVTDAPARAADCDVLDPISGDTVTIPCEDGGTEPGTGGDPGDPGSGNGGGDGEPRKCELPDGWPVSCETNMGTWNGTCHVSVVDPQPGQDDPVWEGNTDGVILGCPSPSCMVGSGYYLPTCEITDVFWSATAPEPVVSETELADRAVAQMDLGMGEIGSTPPSTDIKADSMGIVGVPMWLWVDGNTDPITEQASSGSVTVTAEARLERVVWTYSDGGAVVHTVTCAGDVPEGTQWQAGTDGNQPSPTCGLRADQNDTVGRFTLTGAAHWVVDWEGPTQSGTIPVATTPRSVPIAVGELQTIVTS
jgi:hypothetical protein